MTPASATPVNVEVNVSKIRLADAASYILYWNTDGQENRGEWGELAEALLEVSSHLPPPMRQKVLDRVANFTRRRDFLESQIRIAEID